MKKKEADVRPVRHSSPALDERIRQPKQTREQMVHAIQRKPIVVNQQNKWYMLFKESLFLDLNKMLVFGLIKR